MDTVPAVSVDEIEAKRAYAAALLKFPQTGEGRFQAALSLTPDTGRALWMANKWVDDPEVLAEQKRITSKADEGDLSFIQTEAEFVQELMTQARNCWEPDVKVKYYNLIADVRGFKRKADTQVNVQVNQNKVMIVRDLGSDADWEAKAQKQQRALIDVAASKH